MLYHGITEAAGVDFKPIVFESTGLLHPEARQFFATVADAAALLRNIPRKTLFNYLLTSLNCCLQKALSSAMRGNLARINGRGATRNIHSDHYAYQNIVDYTLVHFDGNSVSA